MSDWSYADDQMPAKGGLKTTQPHHMAWVLPVHGTTFALLIMGLDTGVLTLAVKQVPTHATSD